MTKVARKTRIGVLMDSLDSDSWLHDIVTELARDEHIALYLLQNAPHRLAGFARLRHKIGQVGIARFVSIAFFNVVEALEQRLLAAVLPEVRKHFVTRPLDPAIFEERLTIVPTFSKSRAVVTYSDAEIARVEALELDLMIRGNGTGIYRGKILEAARHGIMSFHHGDNRWNRGGPPAFWEVYRRTPATGFVIQILNEHLDGGQIVFRGEAPTKRSYTENMVNLFRTANPWMVHLVRTFARTGSLPAPLPQEPYSDVLLKTPRLSVTFRYLARVGGLVAWRAIRRKLFRRRLRWSVGFARTCWQQANLSKVVVVPNPPGRFLADPFVVRRNGSTVILVEEFDFSTDKGVISAVRVADDNSVELIPSILEEPFHLSFPFPFEYGGELYMIPESNDARAIRLYRCQRFPDQWVHVMDLMRDVSSVDTIVFERDGRWWMLTNLRAEGAGEIGPALHAFSATTPLTSDWTPHPDNPVVFSATIGRNGGLLRGADGSFFRVRQRYGYNQYGGAASIARIEELSPTKYRETHFCDIEPRFLPNLEGTHHMHSEGQFTVIDLLRERTLR